MVSLKKEFEFMDDGMDIPFYNDVPKLSIPEWLLLLAAVLLVIGYLTVIPIPGDYLPIAFFLTCVIPALYVCKGNYNIFFKKLRLKDIKLIILSEIGIFVYVMLSAAILLYFVGPVAKHALIGESTTIMGYLALIIQIMGEEFFKIFILLIVMYVIYKFSGNRNLSIFMGLVLSMIIFGLVHYDAYDGRILQIILIQGFGSIFEYFAYLKTKNIWVAYLIHLIRDFVPEIVKLLQA